MSLHNFFKINAPEKYNTKKCFIYDSSIGKAYFSYSSPANAKFIVEKEGFKLYYIAPIGHPPKNFGKIEFIVSPSLLKSNLQKAVRRRLSDIAVTTALALIQSSPVEFIRRLSIIFIEDVEANEDLVFIVWLTVADKYYRWTSTDILYLLNAVYYITTETDCLPESIRDTCNIHYTLHELVGIKNVSDTVLCIKLREMYGGMKGDMNMLECAVVHYLSNSVKSSKITSQPLAIREDSILQKLYIIDDAIDFHCFPTMLREIRVASQYKYEENEIQKCIWYTCSGINVRKPWTIEYEKEWKTKPIYGKIIEAVKKCREKCIL